MALPRIAVTACAAHRRADYLDAVRAGGGDPVVVGFEDGLTALAGADGVLLTGGTDVDPARYGQAAHPTTATPDRDRDAFEIAVVAHVTATGLPTLGICRGLQLLNVARGGSLVQDIPALRPSSGLHEDAPTLDTLVHPLRVRPGTRLAAIAATAPAGTWDAVNSRHHQAVDQLGTGLVLSADAPDGVVEGLEDPAHPFLVAVQFHPENFWRDGRFRGLFEALTAAALRR